MGQPARRGSIWLPPAFPRAFRGASGKIREVEVLVLGAVEVRGNARQFTRAWAKELVIYLAIHPDGVSNDTWATALWPDRLMAASSLHSTASVGATIARTGA